MNTDLDQHIAESVEKTIGKRRSVRHFRDTKIPTRDLQRLIQAGIQAPSGSNWQNQRFLVVDDSEEIKRIGTSRFVWPYQKANHEKIKSIHPGGIIGGGAALILVFSDSLENDRRGNGEYHIWETLETQNCSASIENILIMATALGIGTCWISASDKMNYTRMFSQQSWRKVLANYDIPNHYKLQGIVLCGYPKSTDEEGFPKGEKMHGATVWQSTDRKEVEAYMIQKRQNGENPAERPIAPHHKIAVLILSATIRCCQLMSQLCDRIIHKIEIDKYLKK